MTLVNVTRCPKCGAEGNQHWLSTPAGAILVDERTNLPHQCEPIETAEDLL